jgi:hypothetical protein
MYCPNCGQETSTELKFCRACGLGLEKIAQSLTEQLPTKLDESLQTRKKKIERQGVIALSVFGLGILGLLLYGVGYRIILVEGRIFEGIVLLAFFALIASGLLAVYLFAKANEVGEASKKRLEVDSPNSIQKPTTAKLLPEGYREPVAGVTERTTDLLYAERIDHREG